MPTEITITVKNGQPTCDPDPVKVVAKGLTTLRWKLDEQQAGEYEITAIDFATPNPLEGPPHPVDKGAWEAVDDNQNNGSEPLMYKYDVTVKRLSDGTSHTKDPELQNDPVGGGHGG